MNPRIDLLQPYPFERLRVLLAGTNPPATLRHVPLSIGEPRHTPPAFIAEALVDGLRTLGNYPVTLGLPALRAAIARWLERRFGLPAEAVRAEDMVLPVNGTREALFSFVQAAVDSEARSEGSKARGRRPLVLMPNPFYQIYEGATLLAGAEPRFLNCTAAQGYLPDLDAVDAATWDRCEVLFLCTPGNPTGAVMPIDYLRRALELAARHNFVIASDECYSELYFDETAPPPGLLQAAWAAGNTAFERCVVFHSLSKRSSVPGLRSGFVAGDAEFLARYRLYRTYHGCAVPEHTQLASIPAWQDEMHVVENRRLYREKFRRVTPILAEAWQQAVPIPAGGFYLWLPVGDDESFTRGLFERQHVTVLPGSYLGRDAGAGNPGRGRVRVSLVAQLDDCVAAAERIAAFVTAAGRG
ncbi:MAG TPA: succinyldiaminopimelate transaminase [Steroidobacteraceae bacterium]|nr:succinyldiaminopimelate transaminase [Steroidobacteraceae bacterium]